jgi:phosphoribosylformylglycinamidine (FGAM) synthase-like amidotransferase family enzyme
MRLALLCETELAPCPELRLALEQAELEVLDFSWNEPPERWLKVEAVILLADHKLALPEPLWEALSHTLKMQTAKGKPILGLGFGASLYLVETGLVPGLYKNLVGLSLVEKYPSAANSTQIHLRLAEDYQYNAFTRTLTPREWFPTPLKTSATFEIPPGLLAEIKAQGLNVFLYSDEKGQPLPGNNIAALSNKAGTVMALLPHLERTSIGTALFQSLFAHLRSGYREQVEPLYYWPRK